MSSHLTLWVQLIPGSITPMRLEGVVFDDTVNHLRTEISKAVQVSENCLELVYCGNILDDGLTLQSYGLKPGVAVHVLKKKENEIPPEPRTMSESEIQELANAYKSFGRNSKLKTALSRLVRPEVLENIVMAVPSLKNDPAAIAILKDPSLLLSLCTADIVRKALKSRPSLVEAANHIAAAVHEEAAAMNASTSSQAGSSSGYSYSLDGLSDDDDMDSSQSSDSLSREPHHRSFTAITAAQLAAALATAASASGVLQNSPSTNPDGSGPSGSGNATITPEMFTHAIEQAIATVGNERTLNASASNDSDVNMGNGSESSSQMDAETSTLVSQMRQMRELGLTDNALNLQALQATGGDLQAAVNLVLSGVLSSDSH